MVQITDSGPSATEEQLQQIDELVGANLPQEYRDFLIRNNGGVPCPNYCETLDTRGFYSDVSIRYFFGVNLTSYRDLASQVIRCRENELLPSNIIPIGEDEGGNFVCLSVYGDDAGQIFFWDHEQLTAPPDYSNLHLLAFSFDGLINRLEEPPLYDVDDQLELNQIVASRDTERLMRRIRRGWNINELNVAGLSLLESMVLQNNIEIAECLLIAKARPGRALELAENGQRMGRPYDDMIAMLKKYMF